MQRKVLLSHMVIQKKGRYQNCKGEKIPSRSQELTSVLFSANILKSLIKKERKKPYFLITKSEGNERLSGRLWAWLCGTLWTMEREGFSMCLFLHPLWLTTWCPLRKAPEQETWSQPEPNLKLGGKIQLTHNLEKYMLLHKASWELAWFVMHHYCRNS